MVVVASGAADTAERASIIQVANFYVMQVSKWPVSIQTGCLLLMKYTMS